MSQVLRPQLLWTLWSITILSGALLIEPEKTASPLDSLDGSRCVARSCRLSSDYHSHASVNGRERFAECQTVRFPHQCEPRSRARQCRTTADFWSEFAADSAEQRTDYQNQWRSITSYFYKYP